MNEQARLYSVTTAFAPQAQEGAGATVPFTEVQEFPHYVLAINVQQVIEWWSRQPKRPTERVVKVEEVRPFSVA